MSLGPFGQLMMKSLNVAAIFNEAVLANTAPMKTLTSLSHSKSLYLLLFFFLLLLWLCMVDPSHVVCIPPSSSATALCNGTKSCDLYMYFLVSPRNASALNNAFLTSLMQILVIF